MLTSIRCHQLSFSYPGATTTLFRGLDLHLAAGWTGVVGPNGAGKTTLLRILSGDLVPAAGTVEPIGADAPLAVLCAQRVDAPGVHVRSLAEGLDGDAWRFMGLLELIPDMVDRWESLSLGERKRWQVAAALWRAPDLLMLDEPTNHLDVTARATLANALGTFRGLGLLVSHDRELLDALTDATLRCGPAEPTGAGLYRGSYSVARATWEGLAAEQQREREALREEKARLVRQLTDKRHARAGAEARISTSARAKGPRDTDARTAAAKGRVQKAEAKLSRGVAVLARKVAAAEHRLEGVRLHRAPGRSVFVDYVAAPKEVLAHVDLTELRAGDRVLARDVNLAVTRATRLAVWGPNGSGKTTLVRAVLGALRVPRERVIYLPQNMTRAAGDALLAETRSLPSETLAHVMEVVAALGVPPPQLLASASPSPGEARKLLLAHGLARETWLLVLDEPTNHLDLPSIERLEAMLSDYPGAVVLVSHDTTFAQRVCTDVAWLDGDALVVDDWQGVLRDAS